MSAIIRRPQQQSRVPLGVRFRLRRRRRVLHRFDLTASEAQGEMGGAAQLLRQPERRPRRGAVRDPGTARMRKHPARSERQDPERETRRLEDHLERVIPHFESWPLLSGKRHDFTRFAAVCRLMAVGAHREREALARIVELARVMNPSGTRRYEASAILRQLQGGEIVCASGNGG